MCAGIRLPILDVKKQQQQPMLRATEKDFPVGAPWVYQPFISPLVS